MDIKEVIGERLGVMMRDEYDLDVVEVLSWDEVTLSDGYCETCYYEYVAVKVKYRDSKDRNHEWTYRESFAELINYL